jgi:phage terminase large subunit-like protein
MAGSQPPNCKWRGHANPATINNHWVLVTSTPRPIKLLKELIVRSDVHVTKGRTADNAANLPPAFLNEIAKRFRSLMAIFLMMFRALCGLEI